MYTPKSKLQNDLGVDASHVRVFRVQYFAEKKTSEGLHYSECSAHDSLNSSQRPILFIHGIEYASPDEVLRDLIAPMLRVSPELRARVQSQCGVYFIHWPSLAIPRSLPGWLGRMREKFGLTPVALALLLRMPHHFRDLLGRADVAAAAMSPLLQAWQSSCIHPTIITHSMGGYVWARALEVARRELEITQAPGNWLAMQPALPHDAFTDSGAFPGLAEMYKGNNQQMRIWYSRRDLVLSTIYLLSTSRRAMGLVGASCRTVKQLDITKLVGAAHGKVSLVRSRGCFYTRARRIIRSELAALAPS